MRYIAYTTKGLEQVAVQEIKHLLGVSADETQTKRVIFETKIEPQQLSRLKTVDDIGILIGKIEAANLEEVVSLAELLNLDESIVLLKQIREIRNQFSITSTLAGVQDYKSRELVQKLSRVFAQKTGWQFSEAERSSFDIRVFIDRKTIYFSVRLTEDSLHNRRYKTTSKEGSLKSTIAAAM